MAAFEAVTRWYRENLGDLDPRIATVDSGDTPFNLSRCRNLGITDVADPDQVVVVNDADTLPESGPLRAAVREAASSGVVHLPYTVYRWLGPEGTAEFERGVPLLDCQWTLIHGACSGVYVTTPRTWAAHGGQDERFRGWGFEDSAWFAAHTTLLGAEPRRHDGNVFALVHEVQQRDGEHYDENAALMQRYSEAGTDVTAMRRLVFGGDAASEGAAEGLTSAR
jgi:hypothetical protein